MAKPSIINPNPEKLLNFHLISAIKRNHSIGSSSATEFNAKGPKMVGVTEKAFDFTASNTQNQVAANLFLKSFGLINFHCRKPIATKMINLDHVTLLRFDATDEVTINIFHLDGSTILSFIFGGTGRSIETLILRSSSRNPPVKKTADAEPRNGNVPSQNVVHHQNNGNGDGAINPNAENGGNDGGNGNVNGGNEGGNDNGNGNGGNDGGNGNANGVWVIKPITIYKLNMIVGNGNVGGNVGNSCSGQTIDTNIIADEYDSWEALAGAMYHFCLDMYDDNNASANGLAPAALANLDPSHCWPGYTTVFGVVGDDGEFCSVDWEHFPWEVVRQLINAAFMFRIVRR